MVYVAVVKDMKDRNPDTPIAEIRSRLDEMLANKQPEEVFNPETWGTSAEAQAKSDAMMAMVGGMGPPARRRPDRGPSTSR